MRSQLQNNREKTKSNNRALLTTFNNLEKKVNNVMEAFMQRILQDTIGSTQSSLRIIVDNALIPTPSELATATIHLPHLLVGGPVDHAPKQQRPAHQRQSSFADQRRLHCRQRWSTGSECTDSTKNRCRDQRPILPMFVDGQITRPSESLSLVQGMSAAASA